MSNYKQFKEKINQRKFGVLLGLILPVTSILILWQLKLNEKSFSQLITFFKNNSSLQSNILIFSLIPNMFLFYFSNFRMRLDRFTYGLVFSTVLLTLIVATAILL